MGTRRILGFDLPYLRELWNARVHWLYDYRGYRPQRRENHSEKGALSVIEAAYAHLTGPLGIPPEKIIVLGRVVGKRSVGPSGCDPARWAVSF